MHDFTGLQFDMKSSCGLTVGLEIEEQAAFDAESL